MLIICVWALCIVHIPGEHVIVHVYRPAIIDCIAQTLCHDYLTGVGWEPQLKETSLWGRQAVVRLWKRIKGGTLVSCEWSSKCNNIHISLLLASTIFTFYLKFLWRSRLTSLVYSICSTLKYVQNHCSTYSASNTTHYWIQPFEKLITLLFRSPLLNTQQWSNNKP